MHQALLWLIQPIVCYALFGPFSYTSAPFQKAVVGGGVSKQLFSYFYMHGTELCSRKYRSFAAKIQETLWIIQETIYDCVKVRLCLVEFRLSVCVTDVCQALLLRMCVNILAFSSSTYFPQAAEICALGQYLVLW